MSLTIPSRPLSFAARVPQSLTPEELFQTTAYQLFNINPKNHQKKVIFLNKVKVAFESVKEAHKLQTNASIPIGGFNLSISAPKLRDLTIEALAKQGYPVQLLSSFLKNLQQLNVVAPYAMALLERTGLIHQMQRDPSIQREPELDFRRAAIGYLIQEAQKQNIGSN